MDISHCLVALATVAFSCCSTSDLAEHERAKLDPGLQALLTEGVMVSDRYDMSVRPDGTREFGVIVRTLNADALREAGIRVQSVFGDVVTARVSVDELRTAARLPSVRAILNGGKDTLHNSRITPSSERTRT